MPTDDDASRVVVGDVTDVTDDDASRVVVGDARRVVVVGAGLAGVRTCEELRRQGFNGVITLVGSESGAPYDRPPLSKGRDGVERSALRIDLGDLDVDVLAGTTALELLGAETANPPLRVRLDSEEVAEVSADAVVVATGASPIVPPQWLQSPTVRVLRTREDATNLWAALDAAGTGAQVAVLGGSWIGLEFASVASSQGIGVTIYERAAWLLPLLPPEAGRAVKHWCDAAGVEVRLGAAVVDLVAEVDVSSPRVIVRTADTEQAYDLALVALGVAPDTAWLESSDLPRTVKGALKVDAHLRTRDPRVVGLGDAVERWSPRYQQSLPGGHWQDARDQPVVAAASVRAVLGGNATTAELGTAYDAVPYFWSEMFGHTLQFSGFVPDYRVARMVVRGALTDDSWTLCWLDARDRLQAVLSCDRPRDAITARKALAADPDGLPTVDPTVLADVGTPLAASLQPADARDQVER